MENELKLQINPLDIAKFRRSLLSNTKSLSKAALLQRDSIYFDTPDFYFRQHNCALHVRQEKTHWIQTLEQDSGAIRSFHEQSEWEGPVAGPCPDLKSLAALIVQNKKLIKLLKAPELKDRLEPVFETKVRRTVWHILTKDGDQIDLALDQGKIEAGKSRCDINEVALQIKAGNPAALFRLAMDMQHNIRFQVGNLSKAARGYELHAPASLKPQKNRPLSLVAAMRLTDAIESVVANCVEQVRSNEIGTVRSNDPEYVHQMRVGLRRLRLSLELFREITPYEKALKDNLEWAAAALGATRNWEVLAFDTLPMLFDNFPAEPELEALGKAALDMAAKYRRRAATVIGSARYAKLLLQLGEWLERVHAGKYTQTSQDHDTPKASDDSLRKFSSRALREYRRKLLQRGHGLKEKGPETVHRLRITAKKLRYGGDFFQSLPGRRNHPPAAVLNELLSALGRFHDLSVADALLRELAQAHPTAEKGAYFVRGYLARRTETGLSQMNRIWQGFIERAGMKK